jgi:CheY-like chemotaxis protein
MNRPTVLIVEGEAPLRVAVSESLEDSGFETIKANTATTAVEILSDGREVMAVLTDVKMTGPMDGLGLADWMREHTPKIPIVIASCYTLPRGELYGINPAIAIVVQKPYAPGEMAGWLRSLIEVDKDW